MKKHTLVVGASLRTNRYSNIAINRLVQYGHPVSAFGMREGIINGVKIDTELMQYSEIHTVTLYLNPQRQKEYYNYIVYLKPQRVIFNPGTENQELYDLLSNNQINYEIACTLVLLATGQY